MTPAQTKLYLALCGAALRHNGWRMQKCRLQCAEPVPAGGSVPLQLRNSVLQTARNLAGHEHRAVNTRDLRLAVHHLATGRACSSKQITNKDFDRIKPLLILLAEPDNLAAINEWLHPALAVRRKLIARLRRYPGYVVEQMARTYGASDWTTLSDSHLTSLAVACRDRFPEQRADGPGETPAPTGGTPVPPDAWEPALDSNEPY